MTHSHHIGKATACSSLLVCAFAASVLSSGGVWAQSAATWPAIVAAAQKEGKVLLYTSTVPAVMARVKADFEKAYPGILLESVRYSGGPLVSRIEQERQSDADGADVANSADIAYFVDRQKQGLIKTPVGPAMSTWPAKYLYQGAIPVVRIDMAVLVYNTNQVKTPIAGYQDLLRPDLKRRIGTSELISPAILGWYVWMDKALGQDFNARLAAQEPRLYGAVVPGTQAVASGEVAVQVFSNPSSVGDLLGQGAPIKMVIPQPSFGFGVGGAILGWAKRPNAAQVLMDYLISVRGQSVLAAAGDSASARPNIPGAMDNSTVELFDPIAFAPVEKAQREKWDGLYKKK